MAQWTRNDGSIDWHCAVLMKMLCKLSLLEIHAGTTPPFISSHTKIDLHLIVTLVMHNRVPYAVDVLMSNDSNSSWAGDCVGQRTLVDILGFVPISSGRHLTATTRYHDRRGGSAEASYSVPSGRQNAAFLSNRGGCSQLLARSREKNNIHHPHGGGLLAAPGGAEGGSRPQGVRAFPVVPSIAEYLGNRTVIAVL